MGSSHRLDHFHRFNEAVELAYSIGAPWRRLGKPRTSLAAASFSSGLGS